MFDKEIIKEIETLHEKSFYHGSCCYFRYDEMVTHKEDCLGGRSLSLSEPLKVVKALGFKEYRKIENEHYNKKDGWQLLDAYLLKNTCPKCKSPLYIFKQSSPGWTWKRLCGRGGYLLYCPNCKQGIAFLLTRMN